MPIIGSLGAAASRGFGQFLQKITAVLNTDAFFKYVTLLLTGNPPTSTFVTDASTNNLQVTINGNTTPSGFSPNEGGYYSNYFIAGTDYINAPSEIALTGDYTIETWFSLVNAQTSYQMICGQSVSGGGQYISINAAGIEFFLGGGDVPRIYYTFATNTWYHFAIVRSGTTVSAYINGVSQSVTSPTQSATVYMKYIGAGYSTAFPIGGYMSNFRIVNGTAVYTSNFTPSTTPLTAITNTALLTCQSNRFIDNSTNALAITANGNATVNSLQPFTPNPSFATYGSTVFTGSNYLQTTNSVIPTGYITSTSTLTIEAWIYQTQRQTYANACMLGDMGASGSLYWGFGPTPSGNLSFYWYSSGSYSATGNTVIPLNTWTHIAVSISSGAIKLFVNGVLQTITGTSTLTNQTGTYNYLQIGSFYTGGSGYGYFGNISNLRFISGTALYTTDFTPPTTQLTAVTNTSLLTCQTNQPINNNVFLDSSSSNLAITRAGNTTQGSLNPYGGNWSVETGNGVYLTVPSNAALRLTGAFTIEAWIYPTTVSNNIIVGSDAGANSDFFGITTNRIQIGIANGTYPTWATSFVPNTWYHVALTRSSGFLRAFVNGTQLTLASGSANNTGQMLQTAALFIGRYGYTVSQAPFYGNISNLRILKDTALYTASFTPPTAPLTAITNTSLLTCQSNRFVDNSLNNFTITGTQNPKAQRFSPFSPILSTPTSYSNYFNGTNNLNVPNNSAFAYGTGDFTIEAWVYHTNSGSYAGYSYGGNSGLVLRRTDSNTLEISQDGVASIAISSGTIASNQWVHVAGTRSGSTVRLFIDGVLNATVTYSGNFSPTTGGTIGSIINVAGFYMTGYISNLRIVKGTALYTASFTPPTTSLTAVSGTSLLTCQSPTIIDNSTNNFAITANGSVAARTQNPFGVTNTDAPYTPATYGGSMYFDGTGDYLTSASSAVMNFGTNSFTVEFWAYWSTHASYAGFISTAGGASGQLQIIFNASTNILRIDIGGSQWITTYSINPNVWTHLALVRSGSAITLYANGVSVETATNSSTVDATGLRVGVDKDTANYYTGYISNLRLVNGTALYTAAFAPPVSPLQAVTNTTLLLLGSNGAVYDSAMFNDAETLGDSKTSTAQSKFGGSSVAFDGTGDYLKILPSNRYQFQANYTIEFWVYFNSVTGTQDIIGNYVSNVATDWIVIMSATGIQYYPSGSSSYVYSGASSVTANTWYHVAAVRSGSTCSLYLNGVSVGTPLTFSTTLGDTTKPLYIGSRGGSSNYFNGYMDDLRITNGYARYTQNFTVPTQPFPVQ